MRALTKYPNQKSIFFIALIWILYVLFTWLPKYGHVYNAENALPVAGLKIYVRHYLGYRFQMADEKIKGGCIGIHDVTTSSDGSFYPGWIPLLKRDMPSFRKQLLYGVTAYVPMLYGGGEKKPEKMYELDSEVGPKYHYGEFPPDLHLIAVDFDISRRVSTLSRFLFDADADITELGCFEKSEKRKYFVKEVKKLLLPEVEVLFPLWLQYLRDHPYARESGGYDSLKINGDVFFIHFFGDDIRSELNRASYPNAGPECKFLYTGIEVPKDISLNEGSCY